MNHKFNTRTPMPYFVFQVEGTDPSNRQLTCLASFENYREARTLARGERGKRPDAGAEAVRVVFAESQGLAEGLLRQRREAPILQEWEK